jgi:transcription elongation GreA/GreB family factor
MGDFSENVAYSMAKGRLRWLNKRILELESQIQLSQIIKLSPTSKKIEIGNKVTIILDNKEKVYLILGPVESDPENNIISYKSPIGSALMGHKVGDKIKIIIAKKERIYTITKIQ